MPLWVYTLGSVFSLNANIEIPFLNLLINLLVTTLPCLFGLFISIYVPKTKKFAERFAKPFIIVLIFSFFAITALSKFYVFKLITYKNFICVLIPWLGFGLGAIIACFFTFSKAQILAICLETGFQNIGVAFLIVANNFPSPENDLALIPLICLRLLTPFPLYFALIGRSLYNCVNKKLAKNKTKEPNKDFVEESKEMIKQNSSLES